MSYLIHFNKNHSGKDGRFTRGDGDGDGIANDHANKKKNKLIRDTKGKFVVRDNSYVDEQKVSGKQADNIYMTRKIATRVGSANPGVHKKLMTPSDNYFDEQKVSSKQAANIYMTRNIGSKVADAKTISSGKQTVSSNRDNYVDEQKVTNVQAGNIYVTRNLGSSLIDLYEEDEEEKKRKKKRLLQQTTLDGKTLKEEPAKKKQHMGYTNIKQTYKLRPKK